MAESLRNVGRHAEAVDDLLPLLEEWLAALCDKEAPRADSPATPLQPLGCALDELGGEVQEAVLVAGGVVLGQRRGGTNWLADLLIENLHHSAEARRLGAALGMEASLLRAFGAQLEDAADVETVAYVAALERRIAAALEKYGRPAGAAPQED